MIIRRYSRLQSIAAGSSPPRRASRVGVQERPSQQQKTATKPEATRATPAALSESEGFWCWAESSAACRMALSVSKACPATAIEKTRSAPPDRCRKGAPASSSNPPSPSSQSVTTPPGTSQIPHAATSSRIISEYHPELNAGRRRLTESAGRPELDLPPDRK